MLLNCLCSKCVCGGARNLSSKLLTDENLPRGKILQLKISLRKPRHNRTWGFNPVSVEVNGELLCSWVGMELLRCTLNSESSPGLLLIFQISLFWARFSRSELQFCLVEKSGSYGSQPVS